MRKSFTVNGRRYEVTGKTQKEIDDKYFEKRLELEKQSSSYTHTVESWGEVWLEKYKKSTVNNKNYKLYCGRLSNHIYPYIGTKYLSEVTKSDCIDILYRQDGYSTFHINMLYYTMNSLFSTAIDEGFMSINPALNINKPKGKKSSHRSITSEERELILHVASYHSSGLYVLIMLYCGLRPHECALIQGKDVVKNRLHIRGIKTSNADRWVIIPDVLKLPKLSKNEFLFPNLTEKKRQRWWNSFKNEMNRVAGCEVYRNKLIPPFPVSDDLTPYCLRHTFCTDLETAGVPLNIARQLMGHGSVDITSKIYTHTSEEAWNLAAERINSSHTPPTAKAKK